MVRIMKDNKLVYDNPTNDPVYDEWFANQVDKACEPAQDIWDKVSAPPTGSMGKLAEVERRIKREKK